MSNRTSTTRSTVSRRTIVRGAAWATPVLATAAPAPAVAASGPTTRNAGYVTTTRTTGCSLVTVDGTSTSQSANAGYTVQNSLTTTKISAITLTFYFPVAGLTFTAISGSNAGWSLLKATGASTVVNNVTYYAYSSTYAGTVAAVAGNTTVFYGWKSACSTTGLASGSFMANSTATINNGTSVTNSGLATLS